ncbi:MAG: hypothetical protein WC884_02960 [Candidatus Paceibacterota bacterium]
MTGILEVDNMFLFGFGALIIFIIVFLFFIFGVWKFYKTPKEQRGENDTKLQYWILSMILISFVISITREQYNHVSSVSFVISLAFLFFFAHIFLIKKAKMIKVQILILSLLALYSLFQVGMYFIK